MKLATLSGQVITKLNKMARASAADKLRAAILKKKVLKFLAISRHTHRIYEQVILQSANLTFQHNASVESIMILLRFLGSLPCSRCSHDV